MLAEIPGLTAEAFANTVISKELRMFNHLDVSIVFLSKKGVITAPEV
jgi:hypothetical protein